MCVSSAIPEMIKCILRLIVGYRQIRIFIAFTTNANN